MRMGRRFFVVLGVGAIFMIGSRFADAVQGQKHPMGVVPKVPGPRIVIDPGHGGKDPGAIAQKNKIRESDLVLAFSKRLASSLRTQLGADVLLTRNNDAFLELGQRNRFANKKQCDIFLSVHANAAQSVEAEGVEIYYLNRATDRSSEKLARRENGLMKVKNQKEIQAILSDLIQAAATEESALLAANVKDRLEGLQKKCPIEDVKVKTALFYVLVGAKCPSLLIEVGFITHPREGKRLKTPQFQKQFADAVALGVKDYWAQFEKEGGDL